MKILNFVTGNQEKMVALNQIVHEFSDQVKFEMLKLDFEELKLDGSFERIALNKARTCIELMNKENVVVSDVGISIKSLNNFPGTNTAFVVRTIGNEGIIKLMEGVENREAVFTLALAYADKNGNEKVFSTSVDIEIADCIGGAQGFGWDKIVIADGERFSDNIYHEKRMYPLRDTVDKLVKYIR